MYINPNNHFNAEVDKNTGRIISLLMEHGQETEIEAGEAVISQGQKYDFFFIVLSGCFRAYRYMNDKEIIIGFTFTGDIDTAPHAFITQSHSTEVIEAITRSRIMKIHRSVLQNLTQQHPELKNFVETLLANYTEVLIKRYMEFKAYTAEQAYHILHARQPEHIKHIPLKYIASYLGISQERLSRIRNKSLQLT